MAKVRITLELDETLFAGEDTTDLFEYSHKLVLDSIYESSEYKDLCERELKEDFTGIDTDITVTKLEYIK